MKKGFTLVELLGVIVILAVLALIAGSSLVKVLKSSKSDLNEVQLKSIELAAHTLAEENIDYIPSENKCKYITLEDLDDYGLLKDDIKDLVTNQKIDNVYVKVCSTLSPLNSNISTTYEIKYMEEDGHPEDGLNPLFLAEPDLYQNTLVPIVYVELKNNDSSYRKIIVNNNSSENCDECYYTWQVAYNDDVWYDYDNQMWANAAVLRSNVSKDEGTILNLTTDETSDILQMYVWIPRYSYTIKDTYGRYIDGIGASTNVSKSTPGAIDIKFTSVNKTLRETPEYTGDKPTGWYTIPAYSLEEQDGSITEINGIWIGKFESSSIDSTIIDVYDNLNCDDQNCLGLESLRIAPDISTLRNNSLFNLYYASKRLAKALDIDADSHLVKNSEWASVVYLSQSIFGKYGNSKYQENNKRIYMNNSSGYYTGTSGGAPEIDSTSQGTYRYDIELNGTGASTTGSIYGIYDMAGGAHDYVMANFNKNGDINFDFSSTGLVPNKYCDYFDTNNGGIENACNGKCYGQAVYGEVSYGLFNPLSIDYSNYVWIVRGGSYIQSFSKGIGYFARPSALDEYQRYKSNALRVSLFKKTN